MATNRARREADPDAREELRRAKMEAAWPHLRLALRRRILLGDLLEDLAGVVADSPGVDPDEDSLTVGVLTREELRGVLQDNRGAPEWLAVLRRPAPEGCVYVFGALEGLPALYTLGPVFPTDQAN